jgi:hypothetical protein
MIHNKQPLKLKLALKTLKWTPCQGTSFLLFRTQLTHPLYFLYTNLNFHAEFCAAIFNYLMIVL